MSSGTTSDDAQARSVPTLLRNLVDEVSQLLRSELELARAETRENVKQAGGGVVRIAAGALVAFAALIILLEALVLALANVMPPSFASLLVGVVVAVIGFVLVRSGQSNLKAESLAPSRTAAQAKAAARSKGET